MAKTRILRAYSGVRPLVASMTTRADVTSAVASCCSTMLKRWSGRIYHHHRWQTDDLSAVAEWATDAVCRKLGNTRPCTLPIWHCLVHKNPLKLPCVKSLPACPAARFCGLSSWRSHASWLSEGRLHRSLVCECEAVTRVKCSTR